MLSFSWSIRGVVIGAQVPASRSTMGATASTIRPANVTYEIP
jgi:hypothetical protein